MQQLLSFTALLTCVLPLVMAYVNDHLTTSLDAGSFQKPSALSRPRFRYWIPDPSVEEAIVKDDINSAAAVGAGGVEYLPFYNAGGVLGGAPQGANWTKYGFGTPESNKLFVAALEAHRDAGLLMDFSVGLDQGQGVPADNNDEGLQWDLVSVTMTFPTLLAPPPPEEQLTIAILEIPFTTRFAEDGNFDGTIPGWGNGSPIAVISAEVISSKQMINTTSKSGTPMESYSQLTLKQSTLVEQTSAVSLAATCLSLSIRSPTAHTIGSLHSLNGSHITRILNSNLIYWEQFSTMGHTRSTILALRAPKW
jgi:hypothetical protein